ncbi:MAG: hypothetical protein IIX65_00335 [Lachnospiraceae bacterium]|nr:hypothetical protein [Lachnospiraceae bacterium]
MKQLIIEDVKKLTELLFIGDPFDRFLVREAHFVTGITVDLDGTLNGDYYDSDEMTAFPDQSYVTWKSMKALCFQIIKGKKLPKRFHIVLKLSGTDISPWLMKNGLNEAPETVKGLFLTLRYENQQLTCTSGTALSVFTMDKSLDQAWDRQMMRFFKALEIAYTES